MRHPEAKAAKEALIQQQAAGKGPPGGIKDDLSGEQISDYHGQDFIGRTFLDVFSHL